MSEVLIHRGRGLPVAWGRDLLKRLQPLCMLFKEGWHISALVDMGQAPYRDTCRDCHDGVWLFQNMAVGGATNEHCDIYDGRIKDKEF